MRTTDLGVVSSRIMPSNRDDITTAGRHDGVIDFTQLSTIQRTLGVAEKNTERILKNSVVLFVLRPDSSPSINPPEVLASMTTVTQLQIPSHRSHNQAPMAQKNILCVVDCLLVGTQGHHSRALPTAGHTLDRQIRIIL